MVCLLLILAITCSGTAYSGSSPRPGLSIHSLELEITCSLGGVCVAPFVTVCCEGCQHCVHHAYLDQHTMGLEVHSHCLLPYHCVIPLLLYWFVCFEHPPIHCLHSHYLY